MDPEEYLFGAGPKEIMKLFHQLSEEDRHNSINYCMHNILMDMLKDGVEITATSDEDKEDVEYLTKIISEAQTMETDDAIAHIVDDERACQMCFDLGADQARGAYYHEDEDLAIYYEGLREGHCPHCHAEHTDDNEEVDDNDMMGAEDLNLPEINTTINSKKKKILN